jgi:hypothetical protein
MSQRLEEWDWEYRPIQMTANAEGELLGNDATAKDIAHTWYEVWDFACVTWATFNTYALAKEHARHLSNQVGFEHVLNWKHYMPS